MSNTTTALGFASTLVGGVLVTAGITGSSLHSVVQGKPDKTKEAAAHNANDTGGGGGKGGTGSSSEIHGTGYAPSPAAAGSDRAIVTQTVDYISAKQGWDAKAWLEIIERESKFDPNAVNEKSGAYGIGQFLGSTKTEYARYGSESKDPVRQTYAMAYYIINRYGNPTRALEHEESQGWY